MKTGRIERTEIDGGTVTLFVAMDDGVPLELKIKNPEVIPVPGSVLSWWDDGQVVIYGTQYTYTQEGDVLKEHIRGGCCPIKADDIFLEDENE